MPHVPVIAQLFRTRAFWGLVLLLVGLWRTHAQRAQRERAVDARLAQSESEISGASSEQRSPTFRRLVEGLGRHLKTDLSRVPPETRVGSLCRPGSSTRALVRSVEKDFGCRLPPSHELVSITLGELAAVVDRSLARVERRG